jgi:NADPH:quinone reductase
LSDIASSAGSSPDDDRHDREDLIVWGAPVPVLPRFAVGRTPDAPPELSVSAVLACAMLSFSCPGLLPLRPILPASAASIIDKVLSMIAIRPVQPGGPEVLAIDTYANPVPGPDEILVTTEAIGVNYIDVYHRSGRYPQSTPIPLGQEGAGVIAEVGMGVTNLRVGERVAWCGVPGSYATLVVVPAAKAVPVPEVIGPRLAAALLLQGLTAHYLATSTFPLRSGHTALIHAGGGGGGLLLVQLAKRAGARVLATTSTAAKATLIRSLGADEVIFYDGFPAEAKRITGGRGVDVVYDSVGATTFAGSLDSLAPRGLLALYGQSSGPVGAVDPQLLAAKGSLFLTRPTLKDYTLTRAELLTRTDDLFARIQAKELSVRIDRTFPLALAADAHRVLESRASSGKILLIP